MQKSAFAPHPHHHPLIFLLHSQLPPFHSKSCTLILVHTPSSKEEGSYQEEPGEGLSELAGPSLSFPMEDCFSRSLSNPTYLHTFQYQLLKPAKPVPKSPNFLFTLFFKYGGGGSIPVSSKMALLLQPHMQAHQCTNRHTHIKTNIPELIKTDAHINAELSYHREKAHRLDMHAVPSTWGERYRHISLSTEAS